MTYVSQDQGKRLIQDGYTAEVIQTVSAFGPNVYKLTKFSKTMALSGCEQAFRVVSGILGSVCCLPCLSSSFYDSTVEVPCSGVSQKTFYIHDEALTDEWQKQDFAKLGFDKNDQKAIEAFINRNLGKIRKSFGHEYIPLRGSKTQSAYIIFIPHGDRTNASVVSLYNTKSPKQESSGEHIIDANAYCGAYDGNDEGQKIIENTEIAAYAAIGLLSGEKS